MSRDTSKIDIHDSDVQELQQCNSVPTEGHTMGDSLYDYVTSKVHSDLRTGDFTRIIVRSPYTRASPARISNTEKKNKLFKLAKAHDYTR